MNKETTKEFIDRTMRKKFTVIIDETGPDEIFAVGATITDRPEEFAALSRKLREELGVEELKYRKSSKETKNKMETGISDIGVNVMAVYIEKNAGSHPWWEKKGGSLRQQSIMAELSKDLAELDVDFDKIIIDDSTALKDDAGTRIIEDHLKTKRNVEYVAQESSRTGIHKDLLQTNDFAIGIAGRAIKGISETKINVKSRKLE